MKRLSLRLVAVAVAAVLALAACGGGDDTSEAAADNGGNGADLTITMTEFAFSPKNAAIAPGDTVAFRNAGTVEHNWTVLSENITSVDEFSEDMVLFAADLQPGATATAKVDLPAGLYQVICTIPGHFAAGMEGSVTVSG